MDEQNEHFLFCIVDQFPNKSMYFKSYISFSFFVLLEVKMTFLYIKLTTLLAFCHSLLHHVSNFLTNGIILQASYRNECNHRLNYICMFIVPVDFLKKKYHVLIIIMLNFISYLFSKYIIVLLSMKLNYSCYWKCIHSHARLQY